MLSIGTSEMLRAQIDPIEELRSNSLYPLLRFKPSAPRPVCGNCFAKKYTLAAQLVTMQINRFVSGAGPLFDSHEVKSVPNVASLPSNDTSEELAKHMMKLMQEYFENPHTADWASPMKRKKSMELILKLCAKAVAIFEKEPRVLKVQSPCIVFGDIHGNLSELMAYERKFWQNDLAMHTTNYLFLGDYVDRGLYSVEVSIYLFCAKLLAPTQFHLLRGNHEIRQIQLQFTFLRECTSKFDQREGKDIWEMFNHVFDCMPISAVIDSSIFCAHGGIPASVTQLDELVKYIPCPLEDPMQASNPAWEILWVDPISKEVRFSGHYFYSDVTCFVSNIRNMICR